MENAELKATTGTGTQATTGTPQRAGEGNTGGTRSSNLQPGTASSVLSRSQASGIPLGGTPVTTIDLSPRTVRTQTGTAPEPANPASPAINPAMIAVPVLLVLLAAIIFWHISRSAKNTTEF